MQKNSPHNHNTLRFDRNTPIARVRQWCFASAFILISCWVTHTTTATISQPDTFAPQASNFNIDSTPTHSKESIRDTQETKPTLANLVIADLPAFAPTTENHNLHQVSDTEQTAHYTKRGITVKRGDNLALIFKRNQLDSSLVHFINQHPIGKQLSQLSIGKEMHFYSDESGSLKEIHYACNPLQNLIVEVSEDKSIHAEIIDLPYEVRQKEISASIQDSLYNSALRAGLSYNQILQMVGIFGWDIDFSQDIQAGDSFHLIFEDYYLNDEKIADGEILAAAFTTKGHTFEAIQYTDAANKSSYYTPEGKSMLGTFLRSPVKFSRISSRFGKRKHPILKTWRKHNGVDYAAARGTPIRATADGKVLHKGKKGGYGKTVILSHAGKFSTLYAHMHRYAKGMHNGKRVKQGDIIGYVGSTGLATGPHLHYEFRVNGVHRNPLTFKTTKAGSIANDELLAFKNTSSPLIAKLHIIRNQFVLAQKNQSNNGNAY